MRSTPLRRTYSDFRGVDFANDPSLVLLSRSPDALNVWKNYQDTQGSCIESRPGYRKMAQFKTTVDNELVGEKINGMYFYSNKVFVHAGTHLYLWNNFPNTPSQASDVTTLKADMNNAKSSFSIFDEKLYILDGTNYLVYDDSITVVGYKLNNATDSVMVQELNASGNPSTSDLYELSSDEYYLSSDTSVDPQKTYYRVLVEPYVPTTTISRSPSGRRRTLSRRKRIANKKEKHVCSRWNIN